MNVCNIDPTDPKCVCISREASANYKIFDVATAANVCCGTINFGVTSLDEAAQKDDPRCLGWWKGTADNPVTGTIPTPITDFFFPALAVTQNMPVFYGPSSRDISVLNSFIPFSAFFTLPTNGLQGSQTAATCASGQPGWLKYLNPNQGEKFAVSMVCVNPDFTELKQSSLYSTGNWALYSPVCGIGSSSSVCTANSGEVLRFSEASLGSVLLETPNYTGNQPLPNPKKQNDTLLIWLCVIISVAIVIGVIVVLAFYFYPSRKSSKGLSLSNTN